MSLQEEKKESDSTSKMVIAALAGAAVGAGLAMLFISKRERIDELLENVSSSIKGLAEQGKDMAENVVEKTKEKIQDELS